MTQGKNICIMCKRNGPFLFFSSRRSTVKAAARPYWESQIADAVRARGRVVRAAVAGPSVFSAGVPAISERNVDPCTSIRAEGLGVEDDTAVQPTSSWSNSSRQVVVVCRRFEARLSFWEGVLGIEKGSYIWQVAAYGYRLPFGPVLPPWHRAHNNRSAVDAAAFVSTEVSALVAGGFVACVADDEVWVVNPLTVSTNDSGKHRLILDLRYVNEYLVIESFRFEDVRTVLAYYTASKASLSVAATFDLKAGYHHCSIWPAHQKFLGFAWCGRSYVFTVLPFGLSPSGFIFTKLLRPVVSWVRAQGVRLVMFLDDGIVLASTEDELLRSTTIVRYALSQAGWVVNIEKSVWTASSRVSWLGVVFDLAAGRISISVKRIDKLVACIRGLLEQRRVSARQVARFCGSLISMQVVMGNVCRLFSRHACTFVAEQARWDRLVLMPIGVRQEMEFWLREINARNCCHLSGRESVVAHYVWSDASDLGLGAVLRCCDGSAVVQRRWLSHEARCSSTSREMLAIIYALERFGPSVYGCAVQWYTDNFACTRIAVVGSMVEHLQMLALRIFHLCVAFDIQLFLDWVPREENGEADMLSRLVDVDDWSVRADVFAEISGYAGGFTIDLFAHAGNAKCRRFYAPFICQGVLAIDAFRHDWTGEFAYVCPPPSMLVRVIGKIRRTRMHGVLIFPWWTSAPFWPLVRSADGRIFAEWLSEVWCWGAGESMFVAGCATHSIFARSCFASDVCVGFF
jgi:hypothetical protein